MDADWPRQSCDLGLRPPVIVRGRIKQHYSDLLTQVPVRVVLFSLYGELAIIFTFLINMHIVYTIYAVHVVNNKSLQPEKLEFCVLASFIELVIHNHYSNDVLCVNMYSVSMC